MLALGDWKTVSSVGVEPGNSTTFQYKIIYVDILATQTGLNSAAGVVVSCKIPQTVLDGFKKEKQKRTQR